MRRIINSTYITLDGMIEQLEKWHFEYHDESAIAYATEQIRGCDGLMLGRKTYEVFAQAWPSATGELADRINEMPKYVVSSTLSSAEWNNSTIVGIDPVKTATELRQESGGDILMWGFGPVARALLAAGLLDEIHLWVHPVFLGAGGPEERIFRDGSAAKLTPVGTHTLDSGVVILTYRPA
jgi:dihydrofolate reductase